MDDIAEYRRRHREAYLKRVGLNRETEDSKTNEPIVVDEEYDQGTGTSSSSYEHKFGENKIKNKSNSLFSQSEESEQGKRDRYKLVENDDDYEASLELAKKLQREFDSMDEVRKPDDSYKECLLSSPGVPGRPDEAGDVDLQRAIAKSLIDM